LQFSKQIAYNSTHQERFYVRHTEYNRNNIYNQLLYKTLQLIHRITGNASLLDQVGRLQIDFSEISSCTVNAETFNRLAFDRETERYKEALLISKMLLLNYRPDITGGTENVIAILFDMNKLWEEWVYRRLKKEEKTFGITVQGQQSTSFWNSPRLYRPKSIRPDIVINKGAASIIIDTKWKVVEDLIPSDEDLKQMYVYNLFWACNKSILLYPAQTNLSNGGDYIDYRDKNNLFTKCTVQTANIFDREGKLDAGFGHSFFERLFV